MPRSKLLFDVDPGIDDALALLFALSHPDVEVVGIGTVAGNVDVDRCTENTLKIVGLKHRADVPVARGCGHPLVGQLRTAASVHGDDGLGNSGLPASGLRPTDEHAVAQIIRLAAIHPGEITLVALGPLTNVALAVIQQPELPRLVRRLVVMGGAFTQPGNVTPVAEFNVWVDPEAARIVFEAGFDLTLVPLDATMRALLSEAHLSQIGDHPVGAFVRASTGWYLDWYERRTGRRAAAMHDPLATAIAVDPSLVTRAAEIPVAVETQGRWTRGMTVGDRRSVVRHDTLPGRATVCFEADVARFFEVFLGTIG